MGHSKEKIHKNGQIDKKLNNLNQRNNWKTVTFPVWYRRTYKTTTKKDVQ
jgi:hypothetical protein